MGNLEDLLCGLMLVVGGQITEVYDLTRHPTRGQLYMSLAVTVRKLTGSYGSYGISVIYSNHENLVTGNCATSALTKLCLLQLLVFIPYLGIAMLTLCLYIVFNI